MPFPNSAAKFLVKAFTPALEIRYGASPPAKPGPVNLPKQADTFMIRPLLRAAICGPIAEIRLNVPSRLIDITRRHSWFEVRNVFAIFSLITPAEFIRTSARAANACWLIFSPTASPSATSRQIPSASIPKLTNCPTARLKFSGFIPTRSTVAPRFPSAFAALNPIPREPPVINTIWSASSLDVNGCISLRLPY